MTALVTAPPIATLRHQPAEATWAIFDELVRSRRAVHAFSGRPVAEEDVLAMLRAAQLAPSSFNLQPYRFYWVRTPALRERLRALCLGQKAARTAAELVVCVARWDDWHATGQEHLAWLRQQGVPEATLRFHASLYAKLRIFFARGPFNALGWLRTLVFAIVGLFRPTLRPPSGPAAHEAWAIKSAALACGHALLAARARGLDTCPLEGFDERRVARLLGLRGDGHALPMILAVGYREEGGRVDPQWRRDLERVLTTV